MASRPGSGQSSKTSSPAPSRERRIEAAITKQLANTKPEHRIPNIPNIVSSNTLFNHYNGTRKRRYRDMVGMDLPPQYSNTVEGECYNKLRKLERYIDVGTARRHHYVSNRLKYQTNLVCFLSFLSFFNATLRNYSFKS